MRKKEILKLKNNLHPMFSELNFSISTDELDYIQFFDELPSERLWNTIISSNEKHIMYFSNDLKIVSRYLNNKDHYTAVQYLEKYIANDSLFQLFANNTTSIFFDKTILKKILEHLFFFEDGDYLLFGYETKNIITGGFSGFTVWEKTK